MNLSLCFTEVHCFAQHLYRKRCCSYMYRYVLAVNLICTVHVLSVKHSLTLCTCFGYKTSSAFRIWHMLFPCFGYETFPALLFWLWNILRNFFGVKHALHWFWLWKMLWTCGFETWISPAVAMKHALHLLWLWNMLFTCCGFETCSSPVVALKHALHLVWLWNMLCTFFDKETFPAR